MLKSCLSGLHGNIISVVIGTGVASGLILDHRLFMGSSFGAGELGHTTVIPDGPPCPCGNRGCLQALIGEKAILERGHYLAQMKGQTPPETLEDISSRSGTDGFYFRLTEETAEYLSVSIGNLISLLNPDKIVLSGPVVSGWPELTELVRKNIEYRAIQHNQKVVNVISSDRGIYTAATGSAFLVRENSGEIIALQN